MKRAMPEGVWARLERVALLAALVLGLHSAEAFAQGVNVPETRNPHLRKIARLYESLEFEGALELISKAEKHPRNRAQEVLWLELMRGVLYYSLHDAAKSDEAFRRALEKAPFASLPLLSPSQGLYEHFSTLRQAATPSRSVAATPARPQARPPPAAPQPAPDPPAVRDEEPPRESQSEAAQDDQPIVFDVERERSLRPISREVLEQRMRDMKQWVLEHVRNPRSRMGPLEQLEQAHQRLDASMTAHERMAIAIGLDGIEEQLARRFGRAIQERPLEPPAPVSR